MMRFVDGEHNALEVRLETKGALWVTFVLNRPRIGAPSRGCTRQHTSLREANVELARLERAATTAGWKLEAPLEPTALRRSSPMRTDEQGRRLFRDARTGAYFRDLSCERPPTTAADRYELPATDAFTEDQLPQPRSV